MGNCIKRHLKNEMRIGVYFLLTLGLGMGLLTLLSVFTMELSDMKNFSMVVFGESMACLFVIGMVYGVVEKTTYSRSYMTFPCSRRAAFWGGQLFKALYELTVVAAVYGLCLLVDVVSGGSLMTAMNPFMLVILWMVCIALHSMGELIGDLTLCFGKWGFVLYIGLCMVLGGVIGFVWATVGSGGMVLLLQTLIETPVWMIVPLIGVAALFSLLSYVLWRRTTIKA